MIGDYLGIQESGVSTETHATQCVEKGVTLSSWVGEILNSPPARQANFLLSREFWILNSFFCIRCKNGHHFGKLVGSSYDDW